MKKMSFLIISLLILFPIIAHGSSQLPQSGQVITYSTSDDGDIKAGKQWTKPRFNDNSDGTMTDKLTGLTWARDADLMQSRDPGFDGGAGTGGGVVRWQLALDYIKKLNTENYLGFNDWRLPNLSEMASLLNQGQPDTAAWLNEQGFYNARSYPYWSSSTCAPQTGSAWTVFMEGGQVNFLEKTGKCRVWPVRGGHTVVSGASAIGLPKTGQSLCYGPDGARISCAGTGQDGELGVGSVWPDPRFTDNGDRTLTDNLTGLTWTKDADLVASRIPSSGHEILKSSGAVSWRDALDFTAKLNREAYMGFTDWRLPNRNEMASIVNYAEADQTSWLKGYGIQNIRNRYWSSGTAAFNDAKAWNVETSGRVIEENKTGNNKSFVWPVRDGKSVTLTVNRSGSGSGDISTDIGTILWSGLTGKARFSTGATVSLGALPDSGSFFFGWSGACDGIEPCTVTMDESKSVSATFAPGDENHNGRTSTGIGGQSGNQAKDLNPLPAASPPEIFVDDSLTVTTKALSDGYVGSAYSQTLTATRGKTPYTWSISSGVLPSGLTLKASTGVISGTPTKAATGTITFKVKDKKSTTATKAFTITVYAKLGISTSSLPAGTTGTPYSQTLAATGGKAPYTWSITTGSLPAGLSLNASTGAIGGSPTTAGSSSFKVQVKDANNKTASKSLSLTIYGPPPVIVTASLPDGYAGINYTQTLAATGGKPPYTWSCTSSSLPAGLSLSIAGVISGQPYSVGTSSFTVQLKDANNYIAMKSFSITVNPPLSIRIINLPAGSIGFPYGQTLSAIGGRTPFTWSIISGKLPDGLVLDASTGTISGTPTTSGLSYFTVQVKDGNNSTSTITLNLTINIPVSIDTTTLHDSYAGISYSHALSAKNGVPPYTWMITAGSLPTGLSLDASSGMISGVPTNNGAGNFTVQVKDSGDTIASRAYTLNISSFGSISGTVTDQSTGASLPGVTVTLKLTDIWTKNTGDLLYSCNDTPIAASDYSKILANDDVKLSCDGHYYTYIRVRNPYGVADPFTIHWNGLSAYYGGEYLAQSFKPTKSGSLKRVSFYFYNYSAIYSPSQGSVYVLLKSALGGDRGVYLAHSTKITITPETLAGWVDFDFTLPVPVTAGQEYFLELQGNFPTWEFTSGYTSYDTGYWGNGVQYVEGASYRRIGGIWEHLDNSLAFRTYVDADPDIVTTLPTQGVDMHGSASFAPSIYLTNSLNGMAERCDIDYGNNGDFYVANNSGDFNSTKSVTRGSDYYDQNGWITLTLNSAGSESPATALVTDQFRLTFNRTLFAVTDVNGIYSFPSLPDGNYALTFEKPTFAKESAGGALSPGQTLNIGQNLAKALPASLKGKVTSSNGIAAVGITVTITDALTTKTTLTDSQGNYLITGIVDGNYSITFEGPGLQSKTVTGALSPGQIGELNPSMDLLPVTLTVTAPTDGDTIYVNPMTITGSTQNADTVSVTTYNNSTGKQTVYPAEIVNGSFSVSIPLASGMTRLYVYAGNRYNIGLSKILYVTLAPFTVRNLGDTGNITVMEATGNYDVKNGDGSLNDQPRQIIAKEYLKNHGDVDFLVMLTTFDYVLPEAGAQGFYLEVKNDTQGINRPLLDNSAKFGSAGKLQGTIDMGNVTALAAAPYGTALESVLTVLLHETGHRWLSYVRFKNPDDTLNTSLLGKDSAHWSWLLDSKGSVMYGNGWKDNGDASFTSVSAMSGFSPLDLYLMGMIPKEQVPPMLLIENSAIDKNQLPVLGATVTGAQKLVTIDDIIAAEGLRIPDAASSPKKFNMGFVLLTRPGDNPAAAIQAIETLRIAYAGRFAELTGGKGSIEGVAPSVKVFIESPLDGATISRPYVTVSGTVVNSTGAETGVTVNGMPAVVTGNHFIVNHVPLVEGSNVITVTATDVNGVTGTKTASVTATAGHYLSILPNAESGVAPLDVSLILDGSFSIENSQITVSGTAAVAPEAGEQENEYKLKLVMEGTYTVTASALGPDQQTYSDTVTITVISKEKLEALLKGKWEGMKAAVISGDIEASLSYFVSGAQDRYRAVFANPSRNISQRLYEISRIEICSVTEKVVQASAIRMEADGEYGYPLSFVRDGDGVWKILGF